MGRLSERWFGRFSDEWSDPTTIRGFLGGLLSAFLYFSLYVLLLLLALSMGYAGRPAEYSTLGVFLSILGGVGVGMGLAYLAHTRERVKEVWLRLASQFSTRGLLILLVVGVYWLIVLAGAVYAFFYAIAYLVSRVCAVVLIYIFSS